MRDLILWTDGSNRRFHFNKRSQLFICAHNEALAVAAMRISNEDRSTARINA